MLDPDYLNAAGEMTAAVYTQIESEMLEYLTKRMIEGDITNQRSQTALLLLSQSNSQGLLAILNSHKGEISASVSKEVSDALKRSDADDLKRIKKGMGVELPSITSRQIAATVAGVRDILARENLNMVQSAQTAFLTQSIWAITQVNTGAMTTEKALHSAVRKLEGEGISLISYRNTKTGRQTVKNKVDVAIRRHIRTQILQDSMRRTEQILDDAGVELVEVSSHGGARPSHAEWEGRVYSRHGDKVIDGVKYKDFKTACKWGDVADGIGGANCRHSYSAYFPGMKRMYEPDPEHPSGKSNAEVYDLTQKQRSYERDIRDAKRELSGAEQLYKDNPTLENQAEAAKAKLKLQNKQAKMRELINDNPGVLQRSPRREWAGDMPKVKVPKASGRKIDDFLESKSKQLSKAGISKTRMKSALSTELGELGLTTRDFSKLTAKDQVGLFEKVRNSIDAKLPSTKKARAGMHVDKLADVPRGNPMIFDKANGGRVNPNYSKGKDYKRNCQTCVVAFEARLRGYDVTARAREYSEHAPTQILSRDSRKAWIDPTTGVNPNYIQDTSATTPQKLKSFLDETVKPGERYTFQFRWKGNAVEGHIISLDRDEHGVLRLYDPQSGEKFLDVDKVIKEYTPEEIERRKKIFGARSKRGKKTQEIQNAMDEYLEQIRYTSKIGGIKLYDGPMLIRVDSLEFNRDIVDKVLEGA